MMNFKGVNWCKWIYVTMTAGLFVVASSIRIMELYTSPPQFLVKLLKYGKLLENKSEISLRNFLFPKSYSKVYYTIAACVYAPLALYQVLLVYFLDKDASSWFITLMTVCCGSKRIATVSSTHTIIAVFLFVLQIWKRFYDQVFVSVFSQNAAVNVYHVIFGVFFYMGALLILLNESPGFANLANPNKFDDVTLTDAVAIIIFFWAWYHQHTTTVILSNLRKDKKGNVVTESYKLPRGDWFNYLSSPHYVAEIIIYTCLWIILGIKHSWWSVYMLVLINQVEYILISHKWYQENFKEFPQERKMFIPSLL